MKIISIKKDFCSNHSAADYTFISLRKLNDKEKKEVERLWKKKTESGEIICVGEDGFSHESWELFLDNLEDELLEKFFNIEIKRHEILGGESIKFSYDYDEELYKKLEIFEGQGKNFSYIDVKKTEKGVILEIRFYIDPYKVFKIEKIDEFYKLLYEFIKRIREDILKGDFTPLRVISGFYSIKAKVDWKELGEPTERAMLLKKMLRIEEE